MLDLKFVDTGGFGSSVKEIVPDRAVQLMRNVLPLVNTDSATRDLLVRYYSTRLNERGYSSASIDKYEQDGLPVFQLVNSAFEKHRRTVKVLDVGCADGGVLEEMDTKFAARACAHGVTLGGFRETLKGRVFRGPCELLPVACAGQFDLVFSLWSFPMHCLPHISLLAVSKALARGGEAAIVGRPGHREDSELAGYREHLLTPAGRGLLLESLASGLTYKPGIEHKSAAERERLFYSVYGRLKSYRTLVVPWLNAIAEIRASGFTVELGEGFPIPGSLRIVRPG